MNRKTKAVVLPAYNDNLLRALLSLKVIEREIPTLGDHEVLVKMEGAPCNPSDIAFLRGGYNIIKPVPCVPGFEGTGVVTEAGRHAADLLGKRVSCFVQDNKDGTWAEFFVARKQDCIVVKDQVGLEQAACLAINPLTAWALFEQVKLAGTKAIVQNAAGGQVSKLIHQLALKHKIEVINLVRKPLQLERMKQSGVKYVLDTSSDTFQADFKGLCSRLKPGIAFDAVAGESAGMIMDSLDRGGQLIVYGALSGSALSGINPMEVIFHNKLVSGFNLNDWLVQTPHEKVGAIADEIQEMVIRKEFQTTIQGTFQLKDVVPALRAYIKSMSDGKVILTP